MNQRRPSALCFPPNATDPFRHLAGQADLLRTAAIELARHHWKVFPLNGKVPVIANPHPKGSQERASCKGECGRLGHGIYDATSEVEAVSQLWASFPASNIGARIPEAMLMVDICVSSSDLAPPSS